MTTKAPSKTTELTPLMKQYWDIKSLHQDKILLFRMGDFFEMFYDDATKAAPLLGIALTQRNKKSEDQTPMCGMPHHSVAGPINKLLSHGLKVAICDQVEDPKFAKGIVKRAVTRVLTPGMVYDPDTLEATQAHYIACLDEASVSFIDTTTGESFYFLSTEFKEKYNLIRVLPVAEIVVAPDFDLTETFAAVLTKHNLKSGEEHWPGSAQRLYNYVLSLANSDLQKVLQPFVEKDFEHRLHLSGNTLRHLEVFATYKGEDRGSLFQAINKTQTSSGARLLRQWMMFPLRHKLQIEQRLNQIHDFRENLYELKKVREILPQMGDIERRLGKIALPQSHARDLTALADSIVAGLAALDNAKKIFKFSDRLPQLECSKLAEQIHTTIAEDAPLVVKQGYMIKKGFSSELDELIDLSTNAQSLIANLEAQEKEKTGIPSLKIRYNNVFGYYIEITNTHKDKAPKHYQRKQTLANAERFCTDELIELEKKVLSAQTKRFDLEFAIYEDLKKQVLSHASDLLLLSKACSELDVLSGLAWLSLEESYCRPSFSEQRDLKLVESRHPVVEQFQRGKFVPNTISLNASDCFLITGPNMAGKSTLMRQVALTAILAQMGSYVPASNAVLPIYDAIYTRIGASDQLSEGLSTFMVEMSETAQMLEAATQNSLLILDEVGRGTATFDGLCLAQSILEYLLSHLKTHVFFATHYHELTHLDQTFKQIKNVHMKIVETNGQIEFLHLLMSGPAGKSYGIQVAELAGLPSEITQRAAILLQALELSESHASKTASTTALGVKVARTGKSPQMSLFEPEVVVQTDPKKEALISELKKIQISSTSPLQALNQIAKWQEQIQ